MVHIVHEREFDASPAQVGRLIDSLASDDDRLWPAPRWPAVQLDRPLGVGASGGHGPLRYEVSEYEPGQLVRFRFDPRIFVGQHGFEVIPDEGGATVLRHTLEGQPSGIYRLGWPIALRQLHDAATVDGLDRAEAELSGSPWQPRPLGLWVRLTRTIGRV